MDLIKIADVFVEYMIFWIDFILSPFSTLQGYEGLGTISTQLFLFFVIGSSISYFIVFLFRNMGVKIDLESSREFLGPILPRFFSKDEEFDVKSVPVITIMIVLTLTLLFHVVAKILVSITSLLNLQFIALGGTIKDTINGSFAFAAFYIPLFLTVYLTFLMLFGQTSKKTRLITFQLFALVIVGSLFFYFPAALSSTHPNTTYWQAFWILNVCIIILLVTLGWIVGRWEEIPKTEQ